MSANVSGLLRTERITLGDRALGRTLGNPRGTRPYSAAAGSSLVASVQGRVS